MNKGLEVIEAHYLFDLEYSSIHVLIHPEGLVHAMAEFRDGSLRAEMAQPDMRLPIQLAMAWPERLSTGVEPVPLTEKAAHVRAGRPRGVPRGRPRLPRRRTGARRSRR